MRKKEQRKVSPKKEEIASVKTVESLPFSVWYYAAAAAVLGVVSFCLYWPTRNYEFQFDDLSNITKRYDIRYLTFWSQFFHGRRWISYWINSVYYRIAQFNPWPYRLSNISVHVITGVLIFFVLLFALSRLKKQGFFKTYAFSIAFISSLLFLLHPVQTQTVSYVIQGQLEGIAMFFFVLMMALFLGIHYVQQKTDRTLLYLLYFAVAAIGCGSKEIHIIAPALIVLFDWFFIAQGSWQSFKSRLWLHFLTACIVIGVHIYLLGFSFFSDVLGLRLKVQNNIGNVITADPRSLITPYAYFISQFKVILHYLWMFIWPFNISVEYDWVLCKKFFTYDCILPFLCLISLLMGVCYLLKKNKSSLLAWGFLWFFVCLATRSSFIPSSELLVDYKTYAASLGWLFVLAVCIVWSAVTIQKWFMAWGCALPARPVQAVGIAALMAGLSVATFERNTIWSSGLEFWGSMLKTAPNKARIYNNYGYMLSQKHQRYKDSIPFFQKAIEMDSNYPDPHNNLAVVYGILGNIDGAITELQEVIRICPMHAEAYNNLSNFLLTKNEPEKALRVVENAIKLKPPYGKAHINKGRAYLALGQKEKALECFRTACTKADADTEFGFSTYAQNALQNQKLDEALFACDRLLALNPRHVQGLFIRGNVYVLQEKYPQAIEDYKKAYQIGSGPHVLFNLGEAYRRTNQFDLAIECLEKIKGEIPRFPHIGIKLADCYVQTKKIDQAKEMFEQLINMTVPAQIKAEAQIKLAQLSSKKNVHVA